MFPVCFEPFLKLCGLVQLRQRPGRSDKEVTQLRSNKTERYPPLLKEDKWALLSIKRE